MRTLILILILILCLPTIAGAEGYRPGDLFVTRNATEEENSSPGYWNHLAIYVGEGLVVEAQQGQGVIYSELPEFLSRYPQIRVLRLRIGDGQVIADEACRHVGTPYALLASLPRWMRRTERGNNCVSIARRAFIPAVGRDPQWFKPDEAVADPRIEILYQRETP